jgi:hypothetical protein
MISFCLDLSYLYSKLVQTYSRGIESSVPATPVDSDSDSDSDEENQTLLPKSVKRHPHITPGVRHFMAM